MADSPKTRVLFILAIAAISAAVGALLGHGGQFLYELNATIHEGPQVVTDIGAISGALSGAFVSLLYCGAITRCRPRRLRGFAGWGAIYGLIVALISSTVVHSCLMAKWQNPAFGRMLIGDCFALVVGPILGLIAGLVWGKWVAPKSTDDKLGQDSGRLETPDAAS